LDDVHDDVSADCVLHPVGLDLQCLVTVERCKGQ
jgi:hypothetical protein